MEIGSQYTKGIRYVYACRVLFTPKLIRSIILIFGHNCGHMSHKVAFISPLNGGPSPALSYNMIPMNRDKNGEMKIEITSNKGDRSRFPG